MPPPAVQPGGTAPANPKPRRAGFWGRPGRGVGSRLTVHRRGSESIVVSMPFAPFVAFLFIVVRPGAPFVASLFLVAMPFVPFVASDRSEFVASAI